jgi:type VI secretion system protein ImpH
MAAEGGRPATTLEEELFDESHRFRFFQAVRVLERLFPDRAPVGRQDVAPGREVVRFRTRPTLEFPPSEIHQLARDGEEGDEEAPPEMTVAFMGMTGPLGVLPNHVTELVAERARYKDTALWRFLDLFSHRMISLFYRAWERYRFPVTFERGTRDEFMGHAFALVGMGTEGLRGRLGLPDEGLLLYAGLFAQRPHSGVAVESMLGDYFGVPARVETFAGQWLELDSESLTRLGAANSELGVTTIAGARVWDTQSKFRVRFGPLALREFVGFLPAGRNYLPAVRLTRFAAGAELDYDIQLVLRAGEIPECRLGGRDAVPPLLGWTTWLKTQPRAHDDSQVVLAAAG